MECSSPRGTIDMGREAQECKHVVNMKVSFRAVQAIIVFQVSTTRDPIKEKMNPAIVTCSQKVTPQLQFPTIMSCDIEIKQLKGG